MLNQRLERRGKLILITVGEELDLDNQRVLFNNGNQVQQGRNVFHGDLLRSGYGLINAMACCSQGHL
ncbi:hypothetical protein D3C73_1566200 [compost metagenome]